MKKISTKKLALTLCSTIALAAPSLAHASLIYDVGIDLSGQGFGNLPRLLTIQETGQPTGTESGCVDFSGNPGSCVPNASVHDGNGFSNAGGNEITGADKIGVVTAASLGITSADQLVVIFDPDEPGQGSIDVADLTLKFFDATGALLGAIDGQQSFASTDPGVGQAGFAFVVSPDEQAYVNGLLAQGATLALEATLNDAAGGPDTFTVANVSAVPVPAAQPLLGSALAALALLRRRKAA
jgi:hypothetical protein